MGRLSAVKNSGLTKRVFGLTNEDVRKPGYKPAELITVGEDSNR